MKGKGIDMKNKALIVILILVVISLAVLLGMKFFYNNETEHVNENEDVETDLENDEEAVKTGIDIWPGDSRSVAVVIDNVGEAKPQTGINDAAIVYEITVEGGLTRLLAVFKDVDKEKTIGPVRSARPVFIDYVLENDSIFVHFGYSARAQRDIANLKINNVNGLVTDSAFWRTSEKKAPHNVLTNMSKVLEYAQKKEYRTTTSQRSVLNYVVDEVEIEDGQIANTVNIPYTSSNKVSFKYNQETKRYERYVNGKLEKDWTSGEARTTKNIIVTFAHNYTTDEDPGYGRQEIENIGNLKGYYITNGQVMEIVCSKTSRNSKTVYKDKNGKEIQVNDGNTYIQIVPIDTKVTFE